MMTTPEFPLLQLDGYKLGHPEQYPPNTTRVYSNFTARTSRVLGQRKVVFFGLQYFLKKYMGDGFRQFFAGDPKEIAESYTSQVADYLGPDNNVDVGKIVALHELGYVPLRFCALPEGTAAPLRVPFLTVENTHPDFYWLTNWVETIMSANLWLPCTSATTAWRFRQMFDRFAERTGGDPEFVNFQGHDFSFRGMASPDAAAISGAGHLLSFWGTDTVPAIQLVRKYYAMTNDEPIGVSVPATEHAVMCAGGQTDEFETFHRLLQTYPTGVLSIVSDTWDLWNVCTNILPKLKDEILARDGKIVIRPDSGDPINILLGDPSATPGSPASRGVLELLWETFGGTTNDKGYRQLDPHVGAIYGDGINYERAEAILERQERQGFVSTTEVFGLGSYTYQGVTRDTYGMAMKATWAEVDGVGRDLFKDPVTDDGVKKSATGRLAVQRDAEGELFLIEKATPEQEVDSLLGVVWEDGKFFRHEGFSTIRARLRAQKG